ncbi:hypothetical protein NDU88_002111 [Pleurodeles waltl]|uniref:Uncharacterized protein n=1 Tax=Pleurodeles waltl TaxID=8319 RepID=A0AAV7TLM7_PLEWA|nr:hypothetical protein NDU88_002111 [Pleurodeles waltl]
MARGERAGRMMANMLSKPWANSYVTEIDSPAGERVTSTDGVMKVFTMFFEDLYSEPAVLSAEAIQDYFAEISLLWFDDPHRAYFDDPFSVEELELPTLCDAAICGMLVLCCLASARFLFLFLLVSVLFFYLRTPVLLLAVGLAPPRPDILEQRTVLMILN